MPLYTYRREDGTTFELRQSFSDDSLKVDPVTGQKVVRVVQGAGLIFKGSGFYVNDSKGASKSNTTGSVSKDSKEPKDAKEPSKDGGEKADAPAAKAEPAPAKSSNTTTAAD